MCTGELQHVNLFEAAQEENDKRDAGNEEYAVEKAQASRSAPRARVSADVARGEGGLSPRCA